MTASGDVYQFTLRVKEGEGERIEGTITPSGKITVRKREPSFNTYPICLARGSVDEGLIDLSSQITSAYTDNLGLKEIKVLYRKVPAAIDNTNQISCQPKSRFAHLLI